MTILQTTELTKSYEEHTVLSKIDLSVKKSEVLALIGPTGSGKTTLIRLLDLLEPSTTGRIDFDGSDVTSNRQARLDARRRMSYVQQKPVVFSMNVYDNVACGLKWRHESGENIKRKVEDALELVGMHEYCRRDARTLSGGETQRVAIARALVTEPEMLFLDEPTANLDPVSTSKAEQVIHDIIREKKITVVMATHDMAQGQQLASRIGVLLGGELMQVGSPAEIFNAPVNQNVAEFVGIENMLPGIIVASEDGLLTVDVGENRTIQTMGDHISGGCVYVMFRPEDITFSNSRNMTSARNEFSGIITRLTSIGPLVRIELDCGFPIFGLVTRSSADDLGFDVGKNVYARLKVTATHVIKRRV